MKYYREVIDGVIGTERHGQGRPFKNTFFGINASDDEYAMRNLYPEVVIEPAYDRLKERLIGPVEVFEDNQVKVISTVTAMTPEESAKVLENRKAELAALRYEKEIAGVTVGGSTVLTDRLSQAMLTGAFIACQIKPNREIQWKGKNGWTKLNASQISAIASAVSDHVQACFEREKELSELLENDIKTDVTIGWPG